MLENKIEKKPMSQVRYILMMLVCITVWAFAFPLIKLALRDLSFTTLTVLRFFTVCMASLVIILFRSKHFTRLQKKDIIPIFLLGFFGVMMYHFGLNYGEQYVSASVASLIIASSPVMCVLLAIVFLKEKVTVRKGIGIVLALIGVVAISLWGTHDASLKITYITAALAVVMAATMGSIYTIAGKKLLTRYSPLSLTLYAMLLGSLSLIPVAILTPTFSTEVLTMSWTTMFAVIFLGLCSTIIGYGLWYVALEMKTASEISVFLYGVPVLSTIISYLLFNDRLTVFFILGGIFVIGGLILVNQKEKGKNHKQ